MFHCMTINSLLSTCQVEGALDIGKKLPHYQSHIIGISLLACQGNGCSFALFEVVLFNFSLWQVFVSNSLFRAGFWKPFHSPIPLRVSTTLKHTLNHFAIKIKVWKNNSAVGRKSRWHFYFSWHWRREGSTQGKVGSEGNAGWAGNQALWFQKKRKKGVMQRQRFSCKSKASLA